MMATISVSIAEGKKGFSRLVQDVVEKNEDIVVTKRGEPVAVLVPYGEYLHTRKAEAYKKILGSRKAFLKAGVRAEDTYRESKRQLEERH